jgi:hypothetical protein
MQGWQMAFNEQLLLLLPQLLRTAKANAFQVRISSTAAEI